MPTEMEYKYLLSLDVANENLQEKCTGHSEIRQGYLASDDKMNLRVRHTLVRWDEGFWVLTFKQKVPGRQIEIEQKLEARDALDLWEISGRKLKKVRHFFEDVVCDQRAVWELDLFYGPDLYFVMMEIEVEEGAPRPALPTSLEFLKKHILYEVPLTDDRFSNKNLGDVAFATDLYQQIQGGNSGYENQEEKGL